MKNPSLIKLIGYLKAVFLWARILRRRGEVTSPLHQETINEFQLPNDTDFCHKDKVHIFVRGLTDGKLYSAKDKYYLDIRFYKKEGLKVFCAVCRRRIV